MIKFSVLSPAREPFRLPPEKCISITFWPVQAVPGRSENSEMVLQSTAMRSYHVGVLRGFFILFFSLKLMNESNVDDK
jgi:hypothetical protein